MMSQKRVKELRKKNEVTITVDRRLALWLQGFFVSLTSTLDASSLNSDTISARQIIRALEKGLNDATDSTDSAAK